MADANKTIGDLTEEELEEIIEAGRLSDDGDILPAENDEAGSDDDQDIKGSDEGEQGEADAETEGDPGEDDDADKTKSDTDPEKADVAAEADDTDPDKADPDDDTKDVMIPKARLDQEAGRRRQLEEQFEEAQRKLAYFEGRESVRAEATKPASEADPKKDQKTVDALEAEILDIWQQADDGDITMVEAHKLQREKQAEIDQLKQSSEKQKSPDPKVDEVQAFIDDQATQHANAVMASHPYLGIMSEADQSILRMKVDEKIKREGIALPASQIARTNRILDLMGELSDVIGPALTGKTLTTKTAPEPDPTPEQKQQAAKAKAADRQAKLKVAQQQPPSSTATGAAEGGVGEYTDEQIANMSETELEKLPQSVLDRLAN